MVTWLFLVTEQHEKRVGWSYEVRGDGWSRCFGPFAGRRQLEADQLERLGRWAARAKRAGGYAQIPRAGQWVVVLPVGVRCPGRRLQHAPMSRGPA